jgi:peroxin-16
LANYESFLVNNVGFISSLESTLRSVTWILPGRFKDAELASEALSALLNTTSLYHDTLLAKIIQADPRYKPLIPSSLHSRYTRAWSNKDRRYTWTARTLEVFRFLQLVIEMGLRRKTSNKTRWKAVVLIECVKTILRLSLLRITRRPLVSPSVPEREFDLAALPPPSNTSSPTLVPSSPSSYSPPTTPDHLRNNHIPLSPHHLLIPAPPHKSLSPIDDFLLPKALSPSSVKAPSALMKPLSNPKDWLSEIIYIIRPLIYAVLLSRDQESSRPLVTSIVLEIVSRNLRRSTSMASELERTEYARRDRDILCYLLRGSIWKTYTRTKLDALANRTASTPLLGLFGAFLKDWMPLIDEYYYYTAP